MESSQFKKAIGRRLAKARAAKNLSLRGLEEASGGVYPKSTLSNYEQGTRTPDPWDIAALAKLLDVQPSFLLCFEEGAIVVSQEEEKLLRNWRALPENERLDAATRLEVQAIRYRKAVPDAQVAGRSTRDKRKVPQAKIVPRNPT